MKSRSPTEAPPVVGHGERALEFDAKCRHVVARLNVRNDLGSQERHRCGDERRVTVAYLTEAGRLVDAYELFAAANDRDAGAPHDVDPRIPGRSEEPERSGPERRARGGEQIAANRIFARRKDVRARAHGTFEANAVTRNDDLFDRDNRVGSGGERRTRRDGARGRGLVRRARGRLRVDGASNRQRYRSRGRIASAYGEPVHRRTRERYEIFAREQVGSEHAAERVPERNRFYAERAARRDDAALRLRERDHPSTLVRMRLACV
jgi:hypothetical protein